MTLGDVRWSAAAGNHARLAPARHERCSGRREPPSAGEQRASRLHLRHAAVVIGAYTALFAWLFARPLIVIALFALMLGLGGETPAARIAYELPFYDRFRIVGGHLFLAAFAAAALAGSGISAVRRHAVSWRVVTAAAALLAVGPAAARDGWRADDQPGPDRRVHRSDLRRGEGAAALCSEGPNPLSAQGDGLPTTD
jgi:hypothetical protein